MLDLYQNFKIVVLALETAGTRYALCGGMAIAVHGFPRATIDIDLVILESDLERLKTDLQNLGFTVPAAPMTFANAQVKIIRLSKIDPQDGDVLSIDLLMLGPKVSDIFTEKNIETVDFEAIHLKVLNKESLIRLKKLRNSKQDQADIEKLEGN